MPLLPGVDVGEVQGVFVMKSLSGTKAMVKEILETLPEARDNDDVLLNAVYNRILWERQGRSTGDYGFSALLLNRQEYGLPSMETVRRSRQYMQEHYRHLQPSDACRKQRKRGEEAYVQEFCR